MSSESDSDFSESDSSLLPEAPPPVRKWDQFREVPTSSGLEASDKSKIWTRLEQMSKVMAYLMTFLVVVVCSVVSKGLTLFMVKQIAPTPTNIPYCNQNRQGHQQFGNMSDKVELEVDFYCSPFLGDLGAIEACIQRRITERVSWLWALAFVFVVPQMGSFLRSLRKCLFKFSRWPRFHNFMFVLTMETCHTIGLAMLTFLVLPELDSVSSLFLTSCLAIVPSFLLLLSRFQEDNERKSRVYLGYLLCDVVAMVGQVSAGVFWPLLQYLNWHQGTQHQVTYPWAIPVSLVLTSCGWWETFTDEDSSTILGKYLWRVKEEMIDRAGSRYNTYVVIAPFKILLFFTSMVIIPWQTGLIRHPSDLTNYWTESFGNHSYVVSTVDWEDVEGGEGFQDGFQRKSFYFPNDDSRHSTWLLLLQLSSSYLAFTAAKLACKVQIQIFSFACPISCVLPICLTLLLALCGARAEDSCVFLGGIPDRLFFECPQVGDLFSYFYAWDNNTWIFLVWFASYVWVNLHIWYPRSPRLGSSEQIFGTPWYDGIFIDQSLMMNRRRDGDKKIKVAELEEEEDLSKHYVKHNWDEASSKKSSVKASDRVTRIYACATMWHEAENEMMEMLKSLFRVDEDYSARRISQKYFGVVDPDYYEWETHILFDDCMAMEEKIGGEEELVANKFVKQLVDLVDKAGSAHFGKNMRVKPCKKYPTPYGGRLVWTLPGKTKIVCHLKDKEKIRHKKRWSQIMYMYYLLGYRIMELPINDERKEAMAENTYLLALDGDIDFRPEAVLRLVELMKKNKGVGAACGRIHPTGSGFMAAYQKFEYAVGHWLQKATEHVLGCVLCSPGCFSLFRGKAIMDDNVMRKYTTVPKEARQHIQYDQGEDRWLCTLLLQQGWRVEYSAASDSFTECPGGFDEFYNQRRRWMPSTMLNILDLLANWRNITAVNEDVSKLYIMYQVDLRLIKRARENESDREKKR